MKRLKYFAIYMVGFVLFDIAVIYAFDISWTLRASMWLGVAYFIANMAGDIERVTRYEDGA
jgi:NADH:ubiquinone oxidoreductase subunit 3 (subunit A)